MLYNLLGSRMLNLRIFSIKKYEILSQKIRFFFKIISQQVIKSNVDSSILAIVTSQRERFRHRVQELEEHNHIQAQTIQMLQTDLDQLRQDNIKLYEKIKFLQSYGTQDRNINSNYNSYSKYAKNY